MALFAESALRALLVFVALGVCISAVVQDDCSTSSGPTGACEYANRLADENGSFSLLQRHAGRMDSGTSGSRDVAGTGLSPGAAGVPSYTLADGHAIPALGFGTYRMQPGQTTYQAVRDALEVGYRMIDTARIYHNEADVGRAVRDSGVPRSEVFITTKVWNADHGYDKALAAGKKSNELLGLDYIDLLLIHSPMGPFLTSSGAKIVETYDALLELQKQGIVRSVGVSNFNTQHLKALADYCRPVPAVNQFQLHPLSYKQELDLVQYCTDQGILVQAYGSVLSGHQELMSQVDVTARAHNKTDAQVLLRWALDKGFQVIPKSTHRQWIEENFDVFDFSLTKSETEALDDLQVPSSMVKGDGGLRDYWNPLTTGVDVGDAKSHCT